MSRSAPGAGCLTVNGAELVSDASGALYWPARRTLAVADLHLEKGSAYATRGRLLPPYDTTATLRRLEAVIARHRPERVVCLGDSFHDRGAASRLTAGDAAMLCRMTAQVEWIWVHGNHDPAPPENWGGHSLPELTLGGLRLRHEASVKRISGGEISGHFHPKASVQVRSRRVTTRCFVTDGRRLVLPAFGAYTGGLNVLDPAIARLFRDGFLVHMLGREGIYEFPRAALRR